MTEASISTHIPKSDKKPRGDLVYRQKMATRATHWIWAICLFFLIPSGLQIFNAHPILYIGKESGFEYSNAIFQIGTVRKTNEETGARELRGVTQIRGLGQFDTTGVLGYSNGRRIAFPSWITIPSSRDLATGRVVHFFFGWILVATLIVWFLFSVFNGHVKRDLVPTGTDLKNFRKDLNDHAKFKFHHTKEYNVLQKLSYFMVLFVLFPLIILTGLAMSPSANAAMPWLLDIFAGRQTARTLHFVAMLGLIGFLLIHIFMVIAAGPVNNLRSMITGWYRVDARPQDLKHIQGEAK